MVVLHVQECFPADRFLTQMEVEATSSDLHWQLTSMMDQTEQVCVWELVYCSVHVHATFSGFFKLVTE